ncbi:MAG: flavin reductase family protein [Clostridium chrysemydis]|uniref:flavin reductase family protein n=1 Tax=Clostridium chrysemydis TaxID=2665504 RepID=UPI003F3742E9
MKDTFTFNLEESMDNLYKGGAFLTASKEGKVNTMTISWGSVGYMFRKPVFMALVRDSRYTNEFLKDGEEFTISIPKEDDNLKKALSICGTISGRDKDKEIEANIKFKKSKKTNAPVVEGCFKYYECKIIFKSVVDLESLDNEIKEAIYKGETKGHNLYFGEIIETY